MQIWPGQPYPLGATFDGVGTNFSVFSEVAERVELCLVRRSGQGDAHRSAGDDGALLARLPAGRAAGPAVRLSRPRPVGTRARTLVQPDEAAARSVRQGDRRRVELERGGLSVPLRRPGALPQRSRQRARSFPSRRHQSVLRLGERSPARTRPGTGRSSTRRTSRASRSVTRRFPRSCAAPTPAWRIRSR